VIAAIFVIGAAEDFDAPGAEIANSNSYIISITSALCFVLQRKRIEAENAHCAMV
jgi:hypothetical protein